MIMKTSKRDSNPEIDGYKLLVATQECLHDTRLRVGANHMPLVFQHRCRSQVERLDCYVKSRTKRAEIDAATTEVALDATVW